MYNHLSICCPFQQLYNDGILILMPKPSLYSRSSKNVRKVSSLRRSWTRSYLLYYPIILLCKWGQGLRAINNIFQTKTTRPQWFFTQDKRIKFIYFRARIQRYIWNLQQKDRRWFRKIAYPSQNPRQSWFYLIPKSKDLSLSKFILIHRRAYLRWRHPSKQIQR